jgi:hypothetical protein
MSDTGCQSYLEGICTAPSVHYRSKPSGNVPNSEVIYVVVRPGQQISESILADQLRTSRSPEREAIQRLCQERILISRRTCGRLRPGTHGPGQQGNLRRTTGTPSHNSTCNSTPPPSQEPATAE